MDIRVQVKADGKALRRRPDQRILAAQILTAVAQEQAASMGDAQVGIAGMGNLDQRAFGDILAARFDRRPV